MTEKALVTVALVAGTVLSAIFLPNEGEMPKIFLALLSAIWVLPPAARALGIKV
jgi:hypothetical protein